MTMLDPETLDNIYRNWNRGFRELMQWETERPIGLRIRYQRQSRTGNNAVFENWLWENGFTVVQKDKKRYLKYDGNPEELTMFLLRYNQQ